MNLPAMPLDTTHNLAKICRELVNPTGGILTEFVIPVKRKRVDNEDKDWASLGRLPHNFHSAFNI